MRAMIKGKKGIEEAGQETVGRGKGAGGKGGRKKDGGVCELFPSLTREREKEGEGGLRR